VGATKFGGSLAYARNYGRLHDEMASWPFAKLGAWALLIVAVLCAAAAFLAIYITLSIRLMTIRTNTSEALHVRRPRVSIAPSSQESVPPGIPGRFRTMLTIDN